MIIIEEIKVGSLFSGIGGIELGFERAGFKTEWFVECEPYAQAILRKRFADAHIYDDVKKIDFRAVPKVDILTGGFPCQDISNAGKRAGIEGSRSSLWKYFLQAIMQIRPRFALIENVSALTHRGLDEVLCDIASIGYDAEWHCVPAAAVGALHRRDRIFIIAYRAEDMAYPDSERDFAEMGREKDRGWKEKYPCPESACPGEDVPDTDETRLQKERTKQQTARFAGENYDVSDTEMFRFQRGNMQDNPRNKSKNIKGRNQSRSETIEHIWAAEPDVGRVAHGIPNRMDRIKCLGNAVVPQVAEVFAEAIKEIIRPETESKWTRVSK